MGQLALRCQPIDDHRQQARQLFEAAPRAAGRCRPRVRRHGPSAAAISCGSMGSFRPPPIQDNDISVACMFPSRDEFLESVELNVDIVRCEAPAWLSARTALEGHQQRGTHPSSQLEQGCAHATLTDPVIEKAAREFSLPIAPRQQAKARKVPRFEMIADPRSARQDYNPATNSTRNDWTTCGVPACLCNATATEDFRRVLRQRHTQAKMINCGMPIPVHVLIGATEPAFATFAVPTRKARSLRG